MRRSERGMTLIELMVVVAITAVLLTTATALIATMAQVRRDGERTVEVVGNANVSLSLIQFDAVRAGYRFAAPPLSTHILNNVDGTETMLAPITATTDCSAPTWGVAAGTDVLELREGFDGLVPGTVTSVAGGPVWTVGINNGGTANPWTAAGDGVGDIVLFSDGNMGCLGVVTGWSLSSPTVQILTQELVNGTGAEYVNCPAVNMSVMRLTQRVRYLICQPPSTEPDSRPGLYRQVSDSTGAWIGMQLVQEGIEDLQVSPLISNPAGEITGAGCEAVAGAQFCYCDDTDTCTDYNPIPTLAGGPLDATPPPAVIPIGQRSAMLLRGLRIGVTAISTRSRAPRGSTPSLDTMVRPALFDHPVGATPDGNFRATSQIDVILQNITMVTP